MSNLILRCDNCGQEGDADDRLRFCDIRDGSTRDILDLVCRRLDIGGIFTPYTCRRCGALAYPVESLESWTHRVNDGGPLVGVWVLHPKSDGGVVVDISRDEIDRTKPTEHVELWVDHHDGKTQVVCTGTDEDDGGDPLVCLKLTPDLRNIESIVVRKASTDKIKIQ